MKLFGLWTIVVALSISIVAAYYSIVGLAAIFAAALVPIIIMGTVLEIGKITTAIWLHLNWKNTPFLIKTYLTTATIVLMFITSMGIFGFLSKAHIEQNLVSSETTAQIDNINYNLLVKEQEITTLFSEIENLENSNINSNNNIQEQIDREQQRIDLLLQRLNPAIQEQQDIINLSQQRKQDMLVPLNEQISDMNLQIEVLLQEKTRINNLTTNVEQSTQLEELNSIKQNLTNEINNITQLFSSNNAESIRILQNIIGVTIDGIAGNNTRQQYNLYLLSKQQELATVENNISRLVRQLETEQNEINSLKQTLPDIDNRISNLRSEINVLQTRIQDIVGNDDPQTTSARNEIQRLRSNIEEELTKSNTIIEELRSKISIDVTDNTRSTIEENRYKIVVLQNEIQELTSEKFTIESSLRQLEAEVGPIKYVADMIYGDTQDSESLERAVRWMILLIIFVFDPLAIILVIAGIRLLEETKTHVETNLEKELQDITIITPTPKRKRGRPKKSIQDYEDNSSDITEDVLQNDLTSNEESDIVTKHKKKRNGWLD